MALSIAPRYVIGIDPGTSTGIAVFDTIQGKFTRIDTMGIVRAMYEVGTLRSIMPADTILLLVEDPRRIGGAPERAQGAGSIKRDANIWQEFAKVYQVKVRFVRPTRASITKATVEQLRNMCGWVGRTTNHARDAAFLVAQHGGVMPPPRKTGTTFARHARRSRNTRQAARRKR